MTYLKNLTFGASPEIQRRAVELRKRMTPAEKVLWGRLKGKSFSVYKCRR
jgi:very-short-patch-repair endonuclease